LTVSAFDAFCLIRNTSITLG